MIASVTYHVTKVSLGVYGHAVEHCNEAGCNGTERFLGAIDEGRGPDFLPEVRRGDLLEIDYDDSEDRRGVPLDARKVGSVST